MEKQRLRYTELELSNICYGTGNFGEKLTKEQAFRNLDAFAALGGNFIDTANVYCRWVSGLDNCSEQYLGEWLKSRNAYNKVIIATKGGHYDINHPERSRANEKEIRKDLEESLQTMGLEQIDFYWLHRDNYELEIAEIISIMEQFVKEGKIRYYGASNYTLERIEAAAAYASASGVQGFSAVSNQWSMATVNPNSNINTDPSLVIMDEQYYGWHQQTGMPIVPFSSGAFGYFQKVYDGSELSPAMRKAYQNEKNTAMYEVLYQQSKKQGVSVYALSIAWLLNQPFQVFPVASVSRVEQLTDFNIATELILESEFAQMRPF